MSKYSNIVTTISSALLCMSTAYAAISNHGNQATFLGPALRTSVTNTMDNMAYNLALELAPRNYRIRGAVGFELPHQRLKFSAEYLWQNINYVFVAANSYQWINQAEADVAYQYDFGYLFGPQFNIAGYYSHAPSRTYGAVAGTFVNGLGGTINFIDNRRIAGANAAGIAPGFSVRPWYGGKVGVDVNYDSVRYDKNIPPGVTVSGLGGTIFVSQVIVPDLELGLAASVRQPFNNYQASLALTNLDYLGRWTVGIGGAYTVGKKTLPNTYNIALIVDYFMEQSPCDPGWLAFQKYNLMNWTAEPAIYTPEVLGIQDDLVD